MNVFKAMQATNVLYVVGIVAVAIFNNVIHTNPESSMQDRLIVVLAVLFISIPNILSINAIPPRFKFTKTAIVLNVVCILLFFAGLTSYEQERLAIHWGITVISICAINVVVLISGLASKRASQSKGDDVVYP